MALSYINIRLIADNILVHPLMKDVSFETIIRYTVDFMRIMGVPDIFIDKTTCLELYNYRAALPCDFLEMNQVKNELGHTFIYSTDSFHLEECKDNKSYGYTYLLQGNILYSSQKEGELYISYRSIATDKEGYPLLPDNASFMRALELYIKKLWFTILFDLGKIAPAILLNTLLEYAWSAGDCQSEFNRLTIDKMQSFTNMWNTLVVRANEHRHAFRNEGAAELIKIH